MIWLRNLARERGSAMESGQQVKPGNVSQIPEVLGRFPVLGPPSCIPQRDGRSENSDLACRAGHTKKGKSKERELKQMRGHGVLPVRFDKVRLGARGDGARVFWGGDFEDS